MELARFRLWQGQGGARPFHLRKETAYPVLERLRPPSTRWHRRAWATCEHAPLPTIAYDSEFMVRNAPYECRYASSPAV
jgi:hypothetical protein